MTDLDWFAAWRKHRRIALNFTRDALARRAHCSASTLRRLEAGDLRASEQLAASLAKTLNLSADRVETIDPALFDLPAGARVSATPDRSPAPNNLPASLTSPVGRKRDIDTVCELLQEVAKLRLKPTSRAAKTQRARSSQRYLSTNYTKERES